MSRYDFDTVIDRKNTSSLKYDFGPERKNRDDLLPLWVADMDFKLPDEIIEDIEKRVKHGIFGYTDPKEDYYAAVRNWFLKRHGITVKDEWNTITPGVVYAIATAIRALTEEGDAVLIQQPVYYPFTEMIKLNNRRAVNNQLIYRDGYYEIDFNDFENKIISEKVKLFLLCSPHNPVGRVWTKEELIKIADICERNGVYVFADEIHADFVYKGFKHISYLTLGEKYTKKLIVGTSPSKTFNIAGLQIANILIPDENTRKAFRVANEAAGYSQCSALGLTATISAYTKGGGWLDELLDYLEGNVFFIKNYLEEKIPEVRLIQPEGTYLLWLDFSRIADHHKDLEKIIVDKAHLWLDPGIIFGRETNLFERINIAAPRKILEKAMDQLYDAISNNDSER
ncbi:MalY/PatB family protein [Butyrivibrio sp. AE3004]|uniref:MalY/PatB family protein n=1 Tax=Butyrivibrio sp. AE3004 TaxID=1506994 RepID=UPI0004943604|nr:MalY/PatB family protein [Butyrivibrio sp. AE3004]